MEEREREREREIIRKRMNRRMEKRSLLFPSDFLFSFSQSLDGARLVEGKGYYFEFYFSNMGSW